ncbi:MAG: hypothetical protein LAO76_07585 [Acidobacteriia bacterium]|nr:hypothetical protein [Terriglobia bacterium]
MPEKNRSAGITVIAILQIIGSALFLGLAALMAFAMIMATPPSNDPRFPRMYFTAMRVVLPLFYALPAVWGIITSVGLLQLKNWARISTIVISILLIVFGAFGILTSMVFFLKPPPGNGVDPKMFTIIGAVTAAFSLAQIGTGIWWMVFFNRASVKAQFQPQPFPYPSIGQGAAPYAIDMPHSATPPPPSLSTSTEVANPADVAPVPTPPITAQQRPTRPLSISIIAWLFLVGCFFIPFSILLHAPAIVFTAVLTGWPATLYFLLFAGVHIYVGIALLQMKPAGRLVGMGYYIFSLLNVAVFYLAPGRSARIARFIQLEQSMFPWMRSAQTDFPFAANVMPFVIIGVIGGLAFCLVVLYFLAAAKPAFDRAAQQAG